MQSKDGKIEVQRGDIYTRPLSKVAQGPGMKTSFPCSKHWLMLPTDFHHEPLNVKKKWPYLGIPNSPFDNHWAQHTSSARKNQAGMRGQGSAEVQQYTCSGNVASLGLTTPHIIFSLLYVCSFTACTIALILCQNLQSDSHERWGSWAGDHHLGKNQFFPHVLCIPGYISPSKTRRGNMMRNLWLYFLPKHDFAYSIMAWKSLLMILKCSLL